VSGEAKNPAGKTFRLALWVLIVLALLAAPLFCAFSGEKKVMTNEEVVLHWIDNSRKGHPVKRTDPAKTKKSAPGPAIVIREEQIKAVDKEPDGWLVTTKENRLLFVPKSDE